MLTGRAIAASFSGATTCCRCSSASASASASGRSTSSSSVGWSAYYDYARRRLVAPSSSLVVLPAHTRMDTARPGRFNDSSAITAGTSTSGSSIRRYGSSTSSQSPPPPPTSPLSPSPSSTLLQSSPPSAVSNVGEDTGGGNCDHVGAPHPAQQQEKPAKKFFSTISRTKRRKAPASSSSSSGGDGNSNGVANGGGGKVKYSPPLHQDALQKPAGCMWKSGGDDDDGGPNGEGIDFGPSTDHFIPQIPLHDTDGRRKKRVLVLCTGGTLTMAQDPTRDNSLAPVEGALTDYLMDMSELDDDGMPEVVAHEYEPLLDSSDLGPSDWALLAKDIQANYYHFDGFVVLMGTDTMAYVATALSFMLENLGKPVVFTGSQIPLCEPYNDARRNLIMALIFASRDTINEVTIFFHDRLLRACRSTKVNTTRLLAFDSPNLDPLAKIGITIEENEHLAQPAARGALRVHTRMDTRLITLRLVPGFDDAMMSHMIGAARKTNLKGLVLQLYGTGNLPSVKDDFVQALADATEAGVTVVASTQCHTGSVMMGHYATGRALRDAGVVSASDMTLEATSCKLAYLLGRGDLSQGEVHDLMDVSLRGEVTPTEALPPPPLSSAYQRASRKGKKFL